MMNPQMFMQMVFGNQFNEMMNKWNALSPEQKQAELSKVSSMSNEQRMQYLKNMGIDTSMLQQMQNNTQAQQNNTTKFNY